MGTNTVKWNNAWEEYYYTKAIRVIPFIHGTTVPCVYSEVMPAVVCVTPPSHILETYAAASTITYIKE